MNPASILSPQFLYKSTINVANSEIEYFEQMALSKADTRIFQLALPANLQEKSACELG